MKTYNPYRNEALVRLKTLKKSNTITNRDRVFLYDLHKTFKNEDIIQKKSKRIKNSRMNHSKMINRLLAQDIFHFNNETIERLQTLQKSNTITNNNRDFLHQIHQILRKEKKLKNLNNRLKIFGNKLNPSLESQLIEQNLNPKLRLKNTNIKNGNNARKKSIQAAKNRIAQETANREGNKMKAMLSAAQKGETEEEYEEEPGRWN